MLVEGHRVVVIPDPQEEMSPGTHGDKMHIPETAQERDWRANTRGTFHKAGPLADLAFWKDDKEEDIITAKDLKRGKTRLLFVQYAGVIHKEDGETYWFMLDGDVLAIL